MSLLFPSQASSHVQAVWRRPEHIQTLIPAHYKTWLMDKGSLTHKLIEKSQGCFRVEVLQQRIQRAHFSECNALSMPHSQWAVVREVVLYGMDLPWVYARTVIPLSTLHGPLRRLHYLGNKPLGGQLFSDPSMRREPVEVVKLRADQLPSMLELSGSAWGRRSVFRLSNKPLLVSEVFLPSLFLSENRETDD